MPSRRLCLRCGVVTEPGQNLCAEHAKRSRWSEANRGSLGSDWRQIRRTKLEANPVCQQCGRRRAVTVDHILARAFGGTHAWENLQSLCRPCAAVKDRADAIEGKRRHRGG